MIGISSLLSIRRFVSSLRDFISTIHLCYQCYVPNGTWLCVICPVRDYTLVEIGSMQLLNPVRDDTTAI